jgi:hypothetical protein
VLCSILTWNPIYRLSSFSRGRYHVNISIRPWPFPSKSFLVQQWSTCLTPHDLDTDNIEGTEAVPRTWALTPSSHDIDQNSSLLHETNTNCNSLQFTACIWYAPCKQNFSGTQRKADCKISSAFAKHSWLRHCAKSRKIAGSRPDKVNLCNTSSSTKPWGSLSL